MEDVGLSDAPQPSGSGGAEADVMAPLLTEGTAHLLLTVVGSLLAVRLTAHIMECTKSRLRSRSAPASAGRCVEPLAVCSPDPGAGTPTRLTVLPVLRPLLPRARRGLGTAPMTQRAGPPPLWQHELDAALNTPLPPFPAAGGLPPTVTIHCDPFDAGPSSASPSFAAARSTAPAKRAGAPAAAAPSADGYPDTDAAAAPATPSAAASWDPSLLARCRENLRYITSVDALSGSPQFQEYVRRRGLGARERAQRRMAVLAELRRVDPPSFQKLWDRQNLWVRAYKTCGQLLRLCLCSLHPLFAAPTSYVYACRLPIVIISAAAGLTRTAAGQLFASSVAFLKQVRTAADLTCSRSVLFRQQDYDSAPPGRLLTCAEYLVNVSGALTAAYIALGYRGAAGSAAVALWAAAQVRAWAGGHSSWLAQLARIYMVVPPHEFGAPAWQVAATCVLEWLYVLLTLGLGALVSLALLCAGRHRQRASDMLFGLYPLRETAQPLACNPYWSPSPQRAMRRQQGVASTSTGGAARPSTASGRYGLVTDGPALSPLSVAAGTALDGGAAGPSSGSGSAGFRFEGARQQRGSAAGGAANGAGNTPQLFSLGGGWS